MSTPIWILLSLASGWAALPTVAAVVERALSGTRHFLWFVFGSSVAEPDRAFTSSASRQHVAGVMGVLVLATLLTIAVGEALHDDRSFNLEKTLASERYVLVLAASLVGGLAALYRTELHIAFKRAGKSLHKDDTVGWPLQAAGGVLLVLLAILVLRPQLLDKLSSIKAGQVEADFNAGSASSIKEAPVEFLDARRTITVGGWATFSMVDLPVAGGAGGRSTAYQVAGAKTWRTRLSQSLFAAHLTPIFKTIGCFEEAGLSKIAQDDDKLALFVEEYASAIRRSVKTARIDEPVERKALANLHRLAKKVQSGFDEILDSGDVPDMHKCDDRTVGGLMAVDELLDCTIGKGNECDGASDVKIIWDPFVVAAVSDLLAFIEDQPSCTASAGGTP